MARRKQGEAGATRDAVLDAAESGFRLRGGAHASVESIAAQAGWSRGAASYHFRGKAELLRAVLARGACRCCRTCGVSHWRRDRSSPRCWPAHSAGWRRCRATRMPGTSSASWPGPMTMRMTTRAYAARRWPWDCASSACCARCCGGPRRRANCAWPGRPRVRPAAGRLVAGAAASCVATPYRSGVAARPRYARSLRVLHALIARPDPADDAAPPANGAGAGRRKPVVRRTFFGGARAAPGTASR